MYQFFTLRDHFQNGCLTLEGLNNFHRTSLLVCSYIIEKIEFTLSLSIIAMVKY